MSMFFLFVYYFLIEGHLNREKNIYKSISVLNMSGILLLHISWCYSKFKATWFLGCCKVWGFTV